jgi:hypothetical protein
MQYETKSLTDVPGGKDPYLAGLRDDTLNHCLQCEMGMLYYIQDVNFLQTLFVYLRD